MIHINYGKINKTDIANGTGVRVSLFVSGCRNHCKGCFNPETWNFNYGDEFTVETVQEIYNALKPDYISGLTILGGDPFEPENIDLVTALCVMVKSHYPNKTIWIYTGYQYEDFKNHLICNYIDVLVDGRFEIDEKDITLKFKGSRNQRIIDVPASRSSDSIVLFNGG